MNIKDTSSSTTICNRGKLTPLGVHSQPTLAQNRLYYIDKNGKPFPIDHVATHSPAPIDWERERINAARAALQGCLATREPVDHRNMLDLAGFSVRCADALIAELKERDEARREQNADERICAQRDKYRGQRDEALAEVARLKAHINALDDCDLEPSRLEIAARIMQGWAANPEVQAIALPKEATVFAALRIADALIAAAKEVQP